MIFTEPLELVGHIDLAGRATGRYQEKTVIPTTSNTNVLPDASYDALSKVVVMGVSSDIDENIVAGNIKDGVEILGVTGTLQEGYQLSVSGNSLIFTRGASVNESELILNDN